MEQAGADLLFCRPLRPYLDLVLRTLTLLPLDVMLGQWPLVVLLAIFSLLRFELYMHCVVESVMCMLFRVLIF